MKHTRFVIKILCFALLVGLMLAVITPILIPRTMGNWFWPTTQTYQEFYELPKNTVDVLFLGSSYAVNAFSPLQVYRDYGVTSYNLGSEAQGVIASYFWLKEALRFQQPKAVVLDIFALHLDSPPLGMPEAHLRRTMDAMKWSSVKWEAISEICYHDPSQSFNSYLFPHIRYHMRWKELSAEDLLHSNEYMGLMGCGVLAKREGSEDFVPHGLLDGVEPEPPELLAKTYLDRIVELCKAEGIQLIFTSTPNIYATDNISRALADYAAEHSVPFYDMNEAGLYARLGYDYPNDVCEGSHANFWGAQKITALIGDELVHTFGVSSRESAVYDAALSSLEALEKDIALPSITDFAAYLDAINDERYAVFIAVNDEGVTALDDGLQQRLSALGTYDDLRSFFRNSYYAAFGVDLPSQGADVERLKHLGTMGGGAVHYQIESAGYYRGSDASICIDGVEYARNKRGMNIVVYALDRGQVIDSVCFDTSTDLKAYR